MHTPIPFTPTRIAASWTASSALRSTGDAYVHYLVERGYARVVKKLICLRISLTWLPSSPPMSFYIISDWSYTLYTNSRAG